MKTAPPGEAVDDVVVSDLGFDSHLYDGGYELPNDFSEANASETAVGFG
jgi:hypothetical protein